MAASANFILGAANQNCKPSEIKNPNLLDIEAVVLGYYKISVIDIISRRKTRSLIEPRHVLYWLALTLTPHSSPEVGQQFNRDHTSILWGKHAVDDRMEKDPAFAAKIQKLVELVWAEAG